MSVNGDLHKASGEEEERISEGRRGEVRGEEEK